MLIGLNNFLIDFENAFTNINTCSTKKKKCKPWSVRIAAAEAIWDEERYLLQNAEERTSIILGKCFHCDQEANIRCIECESKEFCFSCDNSIHQNLPLHNRVCFVSRYLRPLSPLEIIDSTGNIVKTGNLLFCFLIKDRSYPCLLTLN